MKPANWVHVAGFSISCGIVAWYLTHPEPTYYDPAAHAQDDAALARLVHLDLNALLQHNSRDDIWNAAQDYDHAGRGTDALGCYQRFLSLYPDDPAAAQARARVAALKPTAPPAQQR